MISIKIFLQTLTLMGLLLVVAIGLMSIPDYETTEYYTVIWGTEK